MKLMGSWRRHGWLTWLAVVLTVVICAALIYGMNFVFTVANPHSLASVKKNPFGDFLVLGLILIGLGLKLEQAVSALAWVLGAAATIAIASSALASLIMLRTADQRASRQIAGLLLAVAGFFTLTFFISGLEIFRSFFKLVESAVEIINIGILIYLPLALARFLVLFPRAVDAESIHHTYSQRPFFLRWASRSTSRHNLLLHWHRNLVSGTRLWLVMGAFWFLSALSFKIGLGYVSLVAWLGVALVYCIWGLPFAFASISHIYQFGTLEERQRLAWLRAALLAMGCLFLLSLAIPFIAQATFTTPFRDVSGVTEIPLGFRVIVGVVTYWALMPEILVLLVAFCVVSRGALDPRLAFTRITLWSVLGIFVTLAFIGVERYAAVTIVHWFQLSPDTGAIAAGAIVAGTFVPIRKFAETQVDRLANRWIPVELIARGERMLRAVAITDLSGYTALSARDEPSAILQSTALSRQAVRIAESNSGKLVKGLGDAVMLTFVDGHGALRTVKELHSTFPVAVNSLGIEPLPLHSAIHWGEIVVAHDGDIFGQTVNVTARLVDAARAGQSW